MSALFIPSESKALQLALLLLNSSISFSCRKETLSAHIVFLCDFVLDVSDHQSVCFEGEELKGDDGCQCDPHLSCEKFFDCVVRRGRSWRGDGDFFLSIASLLSPGRSTRYCMLHVAH